MRGCTSVCNNAGSRYIRRVSAITNARASGHQSRPEDGVLPLPLTLLRPAPQKGPQISAATEHIIASHTVTEHLIASVLGVNKQPPMLPLEEIYSTRLRVRVDGARAHVKT